MLCREVHIRSVCRDAHAIVIALREVEDCPRQQIGWIGDVGNRNPVHELDIRSQREIARHRNVLQESPKIWVRNVREHDRSCRCRDVHRCRTVLEIRDKGIIPAHGHIAGIARGCAT